MIEHQVLIAGGGPTGMMLAGELALAGIDVAIIERRHGNEVLGTRARGLHSRSLEVLDQRGIAERFLSAGYTAQVAGFAGVKFDISDFPTRHPYGLALVQARIEEILAGWIAELKVPVHSGREIIGLTQDKDGVELQLAGGDTARSRYVIGCDGGRSFVRKAAGIAFPGSEPTISNLIGEVEFAQTPAQWGFHHDALGMHVLSLLDDKKTVGIMLTESRLDRSGEPPLDDVRKALIEVYGTDFGVHSPKWISRFTDAARQAESYRAGRVLLAGDAAHIHYPVGGQGLNLGLQDAVNLGWKLALVINGKAPDTLLDTYHAERHPVAARVLTDTLAQVAFTRPDDRSKAAQRVVAELLGMDEPRRSFAARMTGLDIRYDLGEGHPLLGRRMPDLDLIVNGDQVRVFTLLRQAKPVLLDLGTPGGVAIGRWANRVPLVQAQYNGPWELPVIGTVPSPTAVLVRPDGYVAWVGESGKTDGLVDAMTTWFGATN